MADNLGSMSLFTASRHQGIIFSDSGSNITFSSFHSCNSSEFASGVTTHIASHTNLSRLGQNHYVSDPQTTISETTGEAPGSLEIVEGHNVEDVEDTPENCDDRRIHKTYQFGNCQVYMNSFNARGVKVKNSGNNAPQVTRAAVDHPGSSINEGVPLSSKSLRRKMSIHLRTQNSNLIDDEPEIRAALLQSSRRRSIPLDPTLPPLHNFQLSEDSLSYPSMILPGSNNPVPNQLPVVPPADMLLPIYEQGQPLTPPRKSDKLPAAISAQVNDATARQRTPKVLAPTAFPGTEFQTPPINPFLPIHMTLYPNFLSHILQPFPGVAQWQSQPPNNNTASNLNDSSSQTNLHFRHYPAESPTNRDPSDTNSKFLEHHLDSALAIVIQKFDMSSSAEVLSPRARNTLKVLNTLVSQATETPVSSPSAIASHPPARFKSVGKLARWLRGLRSPKSNTAM